MKNPNPFTKEVGLRPSLAPLLRDYVGDEITDRLQCFGRIVGHLDVEHVLDRHDHVDDFEAVGVQILAKARRRRNCLALHSKAANNYVGHFVFDVAQGRLQLLKTSTPLAGFIQCENLEAYRRFGAVAEAAPSWGIA